MKLGLLGLTVALAVTIGGVLSTDKAHAQAASWPTFELDLAASSIAITSRGCAFSCSPFSGEFGQGAHDFSWTPASATESLHVDDFFNWSTTGNGSGIGLEAYSLYTELVFASPDVQTASAAGGGIVVQLWGSLSYAALNWTDAASVTFDQGSTLDIVFGGLHGLTHGTVESGVTFIGNLIEAGSGTGGTVSSVPLPGSLVLLLSAFGAFFGGRRVLRGSSGRDDGLTAA